MKRIHPVTCALVFALVFASAAAAEPPGGVVRLDGRTLLDADGPFLGLGATYMQALRHCKFDRPRLHRELTSLATYGFNCVRVLSMVDWPGQGIAPVDHQDREGNPIAAWPDYDEQLAELVDIVYSHGLRTEVTIFADAQYVIPDFEMRRRHVKRVLRALDGREEKVILYEIANEAWQNGFPGEDGARMLRTLGDAVARHTPSLLALTSPSDAGDREHALRQLYGGSRATVATVHFSRDLRTEAGPWLPVIDCWALSQCQGLPPLISNEPIGPGASVAREDDPERILSAAAFAYLAGLPLYVFHSAAGVKAEQSFECMPWLCQMRSMLALLPRDLPNWERLEPDGKGNPLVPLERDVNPLYHCSARKGTEFVQLALALDDAGRGFRASSNVSFSVFTLVPTRLVERATVARGSTFMLKTPSEACIIKGVLEP